MSKDEKLAAYRAFDFDSNAAWQSYFSGLEVPAGRDPATVKAKFQAKWYKREIDPEFDVAWVATAPTSTPASGTSTSTGAYQRPSAAKPAPKPQPEPTPTPQRTPPPTRSSSSATVSALNPSTIIFAMNVILVLLAIFTMLPFRGSVIYFRYFMYLGALSNGYKVITRNPLDIQRMWPQLKAMNLAPLQAWVATVMSNSASEVQLAMMAFMMSSSRMKIPVALGPIVIRAAYAAVDHAYERFGESFITRMPMGSLVVAPCKQLHAWMVARRVRATQIAAGCEIATGFVMAMNLLTPSRNFLMLFVYWNWLKSRYHNPEVHTNHVVLWTYIGNGTRFIVQYVPALQGPLDMAKNWFLAPPGQR